YFLRVWLLYTEYNSCIKHLTGNPVTLPYSTTYTASLRHLVNAILRSALFSKVYPELDAPKTR
ncbi:hypothetical protein ABTN42_21930, partial [Acinetobacter baumannii]